MINANKTSRLVATVVVIAAVVFSVNSFVSAQDAQSSVTILESQLSELVDSQNRLTEALDQLINPKEESAELSTVAGDVFQHEYTCADELSLMPYSHTKNSDSRWFAGFFVGSLEPQQQLVDLNGDGLQDYLFFQRTSMGVTTECVYLNTGSSFEKEYMCRYYWDVGDQATRYLGDCANYGS